MKTGIIVYVTGDDSKMDPAQQTAVLKRITSASRVELISKNFGHKDIADAWWSLTAKGMHRIICMAAEYSGAGGISLTGRELRLCG
jgi:hypothetical protein